MALPQTEHDLLIYADVSPDTVQMHRLVLDWMRALLILAVVAILTMAAIALLDQGDDNPFVASFFLVFATEIFILVLAYGLAWGGRTKLAAWITVISISATLFITPLLDAEEGVEDFLIYLIIPILFSSLLFSDRTVALFIAANLIGILTLPFLFEDIDTTTMFFAALYVLIVSILMLVVVNFQRMMEQTRRSALAERERSQRQLLEAAFDGVVLVRRGVVVYATSAFINLLGYKVEESIIGHSMFADLLVAESDHDWQGPLETTIQHADGTPLYLEILYKFHDASSHLVAVRDITRRKRQEESLRLRSESLAALHETSLALMRRHDMTRILATILQRAAQTIGTEHGYIALVKHDHMTVEVVQGLYSNYEGRVIQLGEGHAGLVWQQGQPVVVGDYRNWDHRLTEFEGHEVTLVGVPLRVGDEVRGVLALARPLPEVFTEQDSEILSQFGNLGALGLDNAQLYLEAQEELAERRRIEVALRDSEQKLRAVVDNTHDVIYIKDRAGRYVLLNPAGERLFGLQGRNAIGKTDDELFYKDALRDTAQIDRRVIRSGNTFSYESQRVINGTEHILLTTKFPYWSEEGNLLGVIGISRDITSTKKAERVLRQSEAHFRSLLENALDIVAIVDKHGAIRYQSPSAKRVLGYTPDELAQRSIFEIIESHDRHAVIRAFASASFQDVVGPMECRIQHMDGTWRTVEIVGINLTNDPIVAGYIVNARDITARKQVEETLRQSNAAMVALHSASVTISSALKLDEVLEALTAQTRILFPQSIGASIQVIDGEGKQLPTVYLTPELGEAEPIVFEPGLGIAGCAYSEGRVINVPDVMTDKRYVHQEGHIVLGAMLVAPLVTGDKVWGTISVCSQEQGVFGEQDEKLVDMLARQAAVVIENVYLFRAEREQRLLAEALHASVAALNSALGLDEILDQIMMHVSQVLPYDAADIMLLDANQVGYLARTQGYLERGLEHYSESVRVQITERANLQYVVQERQPFVIASVGEYESWVLVDEMQWVNSMVSAPILSGEQVIGILNLISEHDGFYSQADAEKLMAFANQVGIVIQKARLFESEQHQREIADILRDIGLVLIKSLSQEDLLTQFLWQMARLIPYAAASIWLHDDNAATARFRLGRGYEKFGVEERIKTLEHHVEDNEPLRLLTKTRHVVIIPDTTGRPWVPDGFEWMRSWAGVPIWIQGVMVGQISIEHTEPGFFGQEHIPILEALATQLSIVLENASLLEQIQQHAAVLETRVAERTVELVRERAQLRAILEAMDEGVLYTERVAPGQRSVISYVNSSLCRITGYSAEQIVGLPTHQFREMILPQDELSKLAPVSSSAALVDREGRLEWRGELKLYRVNAEMLDIFMTTVVVHVPESSLIWSVSIFRDISQEKLLQEQKERFVANASHELRTPLSNLVTRVYLLRHQPEQWEEHIDVIERTIRRLTQLTEDLLDVTQYNTGTIVLHRELVDLVELIENIVAMQQPSASVKHIEIMTTFSQTPIIFWLDPKRFAQVITNLVVNAISYSADETRIRITVEIVDTDLLICVQDEGEGVDATHFGEIFDPFFRATEGKVRGTGLGLTISKEIVEAHGGTIWLESEIGQGSRFYVRLPKENPEVSG